MEGGNFTDKYRGIFIEFHRAIFNTWAKGKNFY